MRLFIGPLRRYYFVRAGALIALALGLIVFFILVPTDSYGRTSGAIMLGVVILAAAYNIWRGRRTAPGSTLYSNPHLAPAPLQLKYYRRVFWFTAIVLPASTVFTGLQLHQLDIGAVKQVEVWEPVAWIYNNFGFWPSIGSMIALWALGCCVFIYKIKALQQRVRREAEGGASRDVRDFR